MITELNFANHLRMYTFEIPITEYLEKIRG